MNTLPDFEKYHAIHPFIKIIRSGNAKKANIYLRVFNYLNFYISVIAKLSFWKPDSVMYYETLSGLPAIIYKKIINRKSRLIIHYHEYTTPDEYRRGMVINRWLHRLEKGVYPMCNWISHTNDDRMGFFISDNEEIDRSIVHILPNYPPKSWQTKNSERLSGATVKFVYVGALSLDTMYISEFTKWIIEQKGQVTWDIYSSNISEDAKLFLESIDKDLIRFRGSLNYFLLPEILPKYDIGVVLYKGHIPNYIYNVPNKLFEYLACGLDVCFPENMQSCLSYVTTGTFPKVISVDFRNIMTMKLVDIFSRSGLEYQPSPYHCETEYDILLNQC